MSIKKDQKNEFGEEYKFAVIFPVVGMKNSGLALAIFDLVSYYYYLKNSF